MIWHAFGTQLEVVFKIFCVGSWEVGSVYNLGRSLSYIMSEAAYEGIEGVVKACLARGLDINIEKNK